jgi:hypothetical protein
MVMAAVMGASGLGFVATRIAGQGVAALLPWGFGAMFLGAVGYAVATVPTQRRQAMARLRVRAKEQVHRDLREATRERLARLADLQASAIKKHLAAEERRALEGLRDVESSLGPADAGAVGMVGLPPQDLAKLNGEWRAAIEGRLRELEAVREH